MVLFRKDALQKAQEIFRSASNHEAYTLFREKLIQNFGFYDGNKQWDDLSLAKVRSRKQKELTFNVCKGFIDNLSGVEIQSRYRTAVRSDSYDENDDKLALALTHLLYRIQESENMPYNGSLKFRDALICGIGWSFVGYQDGKIQYKYISPYNIIPDHEDLTPQFSEMRYVCRKIWMSHSDIKKRWPQLSEAIIGSKEDDYGYVLGGESLDRRSAYLNDQSPSQGKKLIVEVQFKVPHRYFIGNDVNGRHFETFDEDAADLMARSGNVQELDGDRIVRVLYCGDQIIQYSPLSGAVPNQKDFSYIPIVFKRFSDSGCPYGIMETIADAQRNCNISATKAFYAYNSKGVVFEGGSLDGITKKEIVENLKENDFVVSLPSDSKFQILSNSSLGDDLIKIFNFTFSMMKNLTGVYDEMLGMATNATSAIAQNVRQVNSVRNNVFAFDSFSYMKKRECSLILDLIQSSNMENLIVQIQDFPDSEKEIIVLNRLTEIDGEGNPIVINDIRNLPLSLYVEEVPDYRSMFEENKSALLAILGNGNAQFLLSSPTLMKGIGVRDPERVAREISNAVSNMSGRKAQDNEQQMPSVSSTMPIQQLT